MKKLFIITLLLLCFNSFALAEDYALIPPDIHIEDIIEIENIGQSNLYACNNDELLLAIFVGQRGAGGAGATGGSCTQVLNIGTTDDSSRNVARSSGDEYYSMQFTWTPATNTTLKKIQLKMQEAAGDVSGKTYNLTIYSDSGNDPDTPITNATCSFSGSLMPVGSPDYIGCTTTNAFTLTNGVSYHVVVDIGGSYDVTNYSLMRYDGDAGTDDLNNSEDASTWSLIDGSTTATLKIFAGATCSGN